MTKKNIPLIGIGASAGGLDAIQKMFDHMPENTGAAFVIIQHLSTDYKSLMAELLAKHTNMKIFTAEDKQEIKPNCIYLNQKDKNLHVKGNKLYLLDKGPKHNLNLPIDIFFHTLGEEFKENSVGIILSGTGSDGSRGIKTIKEEGGTYINRDYDHSGYGVVTDGEQKAIHTLAAKEGVLLDPVYTGRAFYGLMDLLEKHQFPAGSKILFWHTGGLPALFYHHNSIRS